MRATLTTYKQETSSSRLSHGELDDLQFLIQHEIARREVSLNWTNKLSVESNIDGGAARQIALNLLLNACAASPRGGRVEFEAHTDESRVLLIVRDEGPGLPENVRDYYSHPALAKLPPRNNIGLGVWTICLLASRLGGRIDIDSGDLMGTTISVSLPIRMEVALVAVA